MRAGFFIAVLLLVAGAIFFAPRLGREEPAPVPVPRPQPRPERPTPPVFDLAPLLDAVPAGDLVETYPNEAWRRLEEMRDLGRTRASGTEMELAWKWLAEAREHARRLGTEPRYLEEWKVRTNFRVHPNLRNYPFAVASRPPWLVFVQEGVGAEAEAERAARWLGTLADVMEEEIARPCGLPAFADLPRPAERVLTVVVFRDGKTFREYLRRTGRAADEWDQSWYLNKPEGVLTFLEANEEPAEWADRLLVPNVFQALDVLVHHGIESEGRRPDVGWEEKGMHGMLLFFRQGLVRMFSAAEVADDGSLKLLAMRRTYLEIIQATVREKRDRIEFPDFVRVSTTADLRRKAFDLGLNRMAVQRIQAEFLARSWAFVHYLWHHEDPEVKERLIRYLGEELRGRTGYRYWKKVWKGGPTPESGFEAWLTETIEKEGLK